MNSEIKEIEVFNKSIDCNQYRFRYLEDENIFNIQFAEYLKEKNERNIYYSFDMNEEDFKAILKSILLSNLEYSEKNGIDLFDEALEELDELDEVEEVEI